MSIYRGDFLGFSINGIHSSQLKIVRVSSGDRYEQNLTPEFKDSTIEVPGGDGIYYQGTSYQKKTFTINFAFDELTDYELNRLTQILGSKKLQPLIFDETPYKHYMVKCAQSPNLKFICFEGKNHTRIYKGEGSVNFVAYYPYGLSETYFQPIPLNIQMGSQPGNTTARATIINDGDFDSNNFNIIIPAPLLEWSLNCSVGVYNNGDITLQGVGAFVNCAATYISINMKTHLVEGLVISGRGNQGFDDTPIAYETTILIYGMPKFVRTGELFSSQIESGDFFNLKTGANIIEFESTPVLVGYPNADLPYVDDREQYIYIQYNKLYY